MSTDAPTIPRGTLVRGVASTPSRSSSGIIGDTLKGWVRGQQVHYTSSAYASSVENQIRTLAEEVAGLKSEIARLSEAITALASNAAREVISREVSVKQARAEIVEYLSHAGRAYPSDIAQALNIDYEMIVEILEDLRREGAAVPLSSPR